jgi:hypothetical protein
MTVENPKAATVDHKVNSEDPTKVRMTLMAKPFDNKFLNKAQKFLITLNLM